MLHSLNEIRSLKDPAKQSEVEFVITELPAPLLAKLTQKVAGLISGNTALASMKELRLRCTSFSYPSTKIETTSLMLGGFRRSSGTIQNKSGTWTCKIVEDYQGGVLNILQAWCDLIHSCVLGTRLPRTLYTGTASIIIGEGIKGNKKKRTIWLKGFYPTGISVGEIDPNSSKPIVVTATFNYDWFADNSYSLLTLG